MKQHSAKAVRVSPGLLCPHVAQKKSCRSFPGQKLMGVMVGLGALWYGLAFLWAEENAAPAQPNPQAPVLEGKNAVVQLFTPPQPPTVNPRVLQRATPEATSIQISLAQQRAWLLVNQEVAVETPISSGKRSAATPRGDFVVVEKSPRQESSFYGDFVDQKGRVVRAGVSGKMDSAPSGTVFRPAPLLYYLRLNAAGLALHAGHLPGYPASQVAVRLPEEMARLFYENVQVGTPVTIKD